MNIMMLAGMVSGNPRRRAELVAFYKRQRSRSLKKWRHIISTLLALYYTWKGGSLRVKNGSGVEVDITDPTLTDSERIRALAQQSKLNSDDQRWMTLLNQGVDLIFFWLDDDSELEVMQADLWRTMDYEDAPSAGRLQELIESYNAKFGRNGSTSGSSALPVSRGGDGTRENPYQAPSNPASRF
jgi:hypothetical protein